MTRVISFTLVHICKIIKIKKIVIGKKFTSISLESLILLSYDSRQKHFTLPFTFFFLGSLKFNSVVLSCKPIHQVSLCQLKFFTAECLFNPVTPMSDQERISLNQINTISNRQVMRIKKTSAWGLLVDSIPNSQNKHHRNCMDSLLIP